METQMKHTPGPWTIGGREDGSVTVIQARQRLAVLARVNTKRLEGEQEANACLIAAAPELLEALNLYQKGYYPEAKILANAAIAKAEGRA